MAKKGNSQKHRRRCKAQWVCLNITKEVFIENLQSEVPACGELYTENTTRKTLHAAKPSVHATNQSVIIAYSNMCIEPGTNVRIECAAPSAEGKLLRTYEEIAQHAP